ncbi:MAG TPA: hypothetical protein VGI92_10190 [Gemmatimonadales bacterium]|jgi:L-seryl-tRNA(Ser) seleniumtransferase
MKSDARRALPSVDKLLRQPAIGALSAAEGRDVVVTAIRQTIADARKDPASAPATDAEWLPRIIASLNGAATPTLRRVVNATGVVLHTNFGRAPLAAAAIAAITEAAAGYTTLEYDADTGKRGTRHLHCAALLRELTGAADAMVVNNAAAALLLALAVAGDGGRTIVSRGELIEIGGGFRIPEIMERSGSELVEVGTTNRTRIEDYARAVGRRLAAGRRQQTGPKPAANGQQATAILKVHRSNFRLEGFTAEASLAELVSLGRKARTAVLYDLGGGLMRDLEIAGLEGEPTLPQSVRSGATAVIASGDKLLGGPQAGIIAGQAKFIAACRAHPLARAARADKLTLAGLAATLRLHRDPGLARREIPILRMLAEPVARLEERGQALAAAIPGSARARVVATRSAVGGGAFPGVEIESRGIAIEPARSGADALAELLRRRPVPIVGTVKRGLLILDVRTLQDGDDARIVAALTEIVA